MQLSADQLEWIVQEVVRRLLAKNDGSCKCGCKGEAARPSTSSTVTIADRVVTLVGLRGRLDGATRLEVPQNAVVTPAVKDELKERGIQMIRV